MTTLHSCSVQCVARSLSSQPPEPVVSLHVEKTYSYEKSSHSVELGCVPSFQSEWAPGLLVGWLCVCVVYARLCRAFSVSACACPLWVSVCLYIRASVFSAR